MYHLSLILLSCDLPLILFYFLTPYPLYFQLISDKCADKGLYDFLSLVRTTTQKDANGSCLQDVDDLYDPNGYNNDDYCPSPEFDGFGEKPTFEDAIEENDRGKDKVNSWDMNEVPVADSGGDGWSGWGNGGAKDKAKEKVETGSDPWGSQSATAGTDDAWGNSGAPKQKNISDEPDSFGKKDQITENNPWASNSKEEDKNDPWSENVAAKASAGPSGASEWENSDPWADTQEKNETDGMLAWGPGGVSDGTNNDSLGAQKKTGRSGSWSPAMSDNPWGKSQKEPATAGLSEQTSSARGLPSASEWENNDPWDQPDGCTQDVPSTPKDSNWGNNPSSSQKPFEPKKPRRENNNARHSSTYWDLQNENQGKGTGDSILGTWKPDNQADNENCGGETPKHNTWDQNQIDPWPVSTPSDIGDPWSSHAATPAESNVEGGDWCKEAVSTPGNDGWSAHLASSSSTPEVEWRGPKSKKWNNDSNESGGRGRGWGRGTRGGRPPRRPDGEGRGRGFSRPPPDPLTSEEETILLEIEPMVQNIRRILREAMYDVSLSLCLCVCRHCVVRTPL